MFGGLAFMVNTHMACGILGDDLMVRVGLEGYEQALARGARDMSEFSGRPMRGMVIVPGDMVTSNAELADWVGAGVTWAKAQPPKPATPAKATRAKAQKRTLRPGAAP